MSRKLTTWERAALVSDQNLADGHAQLDVSTILPGLVSDLPATYRSSLTARQAFVEEQFAHSFFRVCNQSMPENRFLLPTASVALEAVAHVLRGRRLPTLLSHPTFDNLADILRRVGVGIRPIPDLVSLGAPDFERAGALVCVLPNNPTGAEVTCEQFAHLDPMEVDIRPC